MEDYRSYSTSDIYWHLEHNQSYFDTMGLVILCDELLKRNEIIKHLDKRFEKLVQRLSDRMLKKIDREEQEYSPATLKVLSHEMNQRKIDRIQWFYSYDGSDSRGPVSRDFIAEKIKEGNLFEHHYVWKEGDKNWSMIKDLPRFKEDLFFDQDIESEKPVIYTPKPEDKTVDNIDFEPVQPIKSRKSGYAVLAGILELVSIPFWLIGIVFSIFFGHNTELGFMIPFMFTVFAAISTIPVAIGLFMRKKWAWSIKIFVASGAIFLIVLKMTFDEIAFPWALFGGYQALIMALIFSDKESYE